MFCSLTQRRVGRVGVTFSVLPGNTHFISTDVYHCYEELKAINHVNVATSKPVKQHMQRIWELTLLLNFHKDWLPFV